MADQPIGVIFTRNIRILVACIPWKSQNNGHVSSNIPEADGVKESTQSFSE